MNLFDMLLTVLVTCVSGIEIAHIVLESMGMRDCDYTTWEVSLLGTALRCIICASLMWKFAFT